MITTSKSKVIKQTPELSSISFLNMDGLLTTEDYMLSEDSKHYVSKEDFKKLGKVEKWSDGSEDTYLKRFRGGRPGEIIFDPYAMLSKPTDLSAFATQRGERFCEYVKVKPELFDCYRAYLETRNPRYFASVDKAMKDGDNYE